MITNDLNWCSADVLLCHAHIIRYNKYISNEKFRALQEIQTETGDLCITTVCSLDQQRFLSPTMLIAGDKAGQPDVDQNESPGRVGVASEALSDSANLGQRRSLTSDTPPAGSSRHGRPEVADGWRTVAGVERLYWDEMFISSASKVTADSATWRDAAAENTSPKISICFKALCIHFIQKYASIPEDHHAVSLKYGCSSGIKWCYFI